MHPIIDKNKTKTIWEGMFRKLFGRRGKAASASASASVSASDEDGPVVIDMRDEDWLEDDGEDFTPNPPPAQRVADRCLAMAAVALKAVAEFNLLKTEDPVEAWQQAADGLGEWCVTQPFAAELEDREKVFLRAAAEETDDDDRFDRLASVEGAHVLYWALGLADLPPHDAPTDIHGFAAELGLVGRSVSKLLSDPRLRPVDQLLAAEWQLTMVHWRFRQFAMDHQPLDFAEICRTSWWNPGEFPEDMLVDGDLRYGVLPIFALEPEAFGTAFHVAFHRHQAIRWLIGDNPVYSEVDTGT
jgi:hypothetical protein